MTKKLSAHNDLSDEALIKKFDIVRRRRNKALNDLEELATELNTRLGKSKPVGAITTAAGYASWAFRSVTCIDKEMQRRLIASGALKTHTRRDRRLNVVVPGKK